MKDKECTEKIRSLKEFQDLSIDEKVYFQKSTGNIHPQVIYNTYGALKNIVDVLEHLNKKK